MATATTASTRPGDDPNAGLPRMTVSLLGVSGSGKSTFILGAYHTLNRGENGCFLRTDHNAHVRLQAQWDELDLSGREPPMTSEPVRHHFTFSRDGRSLAAIDLTDYRGGVLYSMTGANRDSDTAKMIDGLAASDAILIAVDSVHLAEPLGGREVSAARAIGVGPISNLLNDAFAVRRYRRQPLPQLAVLLTKADLLDAALSGYGRTFDELRAEVRALLPAAFPPDGNTAFYPVTLGPLRSDWQGATAPGRLSPVALHLPLVFIVAGFLAGVAETMRWQSTALRTQYDQARAVCDALRTKRGFGRRRRRKRLLAAEANVLRLAEYGRDLDARRTALANEAMQLRGSAR